MWDIVALVISVIFFTWMYVDLRIEVNALLRKIDELNLSIENLEREKRR